MSQPIRIKKRKLFIHIAHQGFRVVAGGMVVQFCPNREEVLRIGFTVTKKLGKAVVRNRIRRRLRELVRTCEPLKELSGLDLVFVGRQSTLNRPYPKLKSDLAFALKEIKTKQAEAEEKDV